MKKLNIKLHTKIVIGLVLGAIFGGIFHVDKNKVEISFRQNDRLQRLILEDWDSIEFKIKDRSETFLEQQQIIQRFKILSEEEKRNLVLIYTKNDQSIEIKSIQQIQRVNSIAVSIKPIGDIFIRLLNMIAIPLVLASLIVGVASLGDIKKLARIGGKTIGFYIVTTALAISLGLSIASIIKPGERINQITRDELAQVYKNEIAQKLQTEPQFNIKDQIVNLVPRNIFKSLTDAEMLQIVFFALMSGIAISLISKQKSEPVIKFFEGLSDAMIKLVDIIMKIAPYGVFALISATVAEFGFDILKTLIWYVLTVLLGLVVHLFFVYGFIVKFFGKIEIGSFLKGIRRAQIVAFSTSSSAATLPVNMECCEENLGISKSITSFTLPLGATINMDGTALYQGVAAVFIAQVFGMELNFFDQLMIVLTAVLASIGTAPVPGVGIIMLLIILKTVHIPEIGVALILGVDRILDMCRTVVNVTGDAAVSVAIAKSENQINRIDLSEA